jgi:hypothetical protein|tara:strand:- start:33 stop:374 length:342 start_codon:yes stop_codon:yes gene_type:complete
MDDTESKKYTLTNEYLCRLGAEGERQHTRTLDVLKSVLAQETHQEHLVGLLTELYFLNIRLGEEVGRYDTGTCEEEGEFVVEEPDLLFLRMIVFGKHKIITELAKRNISLAEN